MPTNLSGLKSAAKECVIAITNLHANIVSRPTVMGGQKAVTIHTMTNHKGRKAITLCGSAALLVLAAGWGGVANGESPSSITTPTTITTTKSPFSNLTQAPSPPATSGGQTGGAVPGRPIGGPEGCIIGLNCASIPRIPHRTFDTPPPDSPPPPRANPDVSQQPSDYN